VTGDRVVVVGDRDAVFGLALLGLDGVPVSTATEAREALQQVLADRSVAVVLLTEDWGETLRAEVDQLAAGGGPLVVEIPAPIPVDRSATLHQRVERVLGIRLGG